jgi:site-specific DNA-methyltransferase (adenine-specific)
MKNRAFDHSKYQHWIDPNEVTPYERNAKQHTDKQIKNICTSIRRFGWQQDTVLTTDNVLVIGHGRRLAALKIGCEMPYHVIDKTADELTDEDIRELRIADNQTNAETGLDFDTLNIEIEDLDFDGFDFDFGIDTEEQDEEPTEIVEDEPPTETETRCKVGDLWQLGSHRLICGDSTDVAVIDRLMDGVKADCVFTDPPYNIASDSKNFASDVSKAMKTLSESEWDKNFDIREVLDNILVSIAENATVYVCTSHFLAPEIWEWMKQWSDHYSYCVWSKPNSMPSLSKSHWTWNTELICYATRGKHTFNFPKEGHALSTWTINKRNGDTGHPTEKPVEVPAMAISHSSKENDVVLDLFGGSGSTLIACEQLNRKCYMCELDEHYCSVIIQRWENFTGEKAVLLDA